MPRRDVIADEQGEPLRYIFIERPRCPVCSKANLRTLRCKTDRLEDTVSRRTLCLECGHRFFVILE